MIAVWVTLGILGGLLYLFIGIKVTGFSKASLQFLDVYDTVALIDLIFWPIYLLWVGALYLFLVPEYIWKKIKRRKRR